MTTPHPEASTAPVSTVDAVHAAAHALAWETAHALRTDSLDSPVTLAHLREAVDRWEQATTRLHEKTMQTLADIPPANIRCRRCGSADGCDACDQAAEAAKFGDYEDADPFGWQADRAATRQEICR